MESWIILSIISGILVGLSNFVAKISASNHFNKDRIIFFGNLVALVFSSTYLILQYRYVEVSLFIFMLILVRIIAASEKNLFIIEGLKHIETSLFFPIHKILHMFATFVIGMVLFGEYLNLIQYIAVFLGIIMILLLTDKEEKKKQIDYKKGIMFMLLANLVLLFSSSINKYLSVNEFDVPTYLFYSAIFGCLYFILTKKKIYEKSSKQRIYRELRYGILRGCFLFFGFLAVFLALRTGPLVLVGMINSIAIFVPIILSIIVYHEKITYKKIFSFLLFVIIIILLAIAKTN